MKITNITHSAFAVLLLASSTAGAETQYPASDFQPKVVYQDPDYQHAATASSASSAQAAPAKTADSQYPASDFQPKVLYNDPSYQHNQSTGSSGSSMQKSASVPEASSAAPEAKKEESSSSYLLGLLVLAAVGFVLFRKKSPDTTKASSAESHTSGSVGGLTGVAKYINRKAGTGVSRYLEQQVKSTASTAATGVAKYMAKQADSTKQSAAEAATGVEKYLRNRG